MAKRKGQAKTHPQSLIRGLIVKLVLGAVVIIGAITALGYGVVYDRAERDALNRLADYVAERGRFESAVFLRTESAMRTFADHFLENYRDDAVLPDPDFKDYFFQSADKAVRLKREYFDGMVGPDGLRIAGVSAFVGDNVRYFSKEFRRRILLAVKLVGRYGPAWADLNLHVSFPENAIVVYWPEAPWGLNAAPNLRMNQGSVIKATLQSENPDRKPVWSGLYFDLTAKRWSITHQLPVDLDGRHLINPSADVHLTDLMRRIIEDRLPGTSNYIFSKAGDVVANSRSLGEKDYVKGVISIDEVEDPVVRAVYGAMAQGMKAPPSPLNDDRDRSVWLVDAPELDAYLAFTELSGPDWVYVVAYPKSLLRPIAHQAAGVLVGLGAGIFVFFTLVMVVILSRDIARPINLLEAAAEKVGEGAYDVVAEDSYPLPESVPNEIGLFAREFRSMTRRVRDTNHNLERIVAERTADLEEANRKLTELSLIDGLTRARNRRSFDMDLAEAFEIHHRDGEAFALALFDVDHFKKYNDTQGHQKGDDVLKSIVATLQQASRAADRVYRYGGEELAVIFSDTDQMEARTVAQRLVDAVAREGIPHPASSIGHVSISGGLSVAEGGISSPKDLIQRADEKLYEAKHSGRNRLVG
ncbi:MAG: diguanylate cyclase [Rhodospirillum sp.]|nr:diguanylate cyclase [Rhodospirillum sp.]MCF8492029.1 diguanylate cyclase [Rhodospirillum sp.]MCF8502254.1 diguanylate cyclase [Rhodospirillum sp.]